MAGQVAGRLDCKGSAPSPHLEPPGSRTAGQQAVCFLLTAGKPRSQVLKAQLPMAGIAEGQCQPVHRPSKERSAWFLEWWQLEVICGHQL